jgi:hypothetical protein
MLTFFPGKNLATHNHALHNIRSEELHCALDRYNCDFEIRSVSQPASTNYGRIFHAA